MSIDNLTTLIGKNDIGKSTILEALEIFFNSETIKIDSSDSNVYNGHKTVTIACEFTDLPCEIVLDASSTTTLEGEYLLTESGTLKIVKEYDCGKSNPTIEIYILANHPTATGAENLLELKEKELQSIIKQRSIVSGLKGNPTMRAAIWNSYSDLELKLVKIPVSKPKEDSKRIWEQIDSYLPIYALFQSDRNSQDKDKEVQNPMKVAITAAIAEVQDDINKIQQKVQEKAIEIAHNTQEALKKIDSKLANKLEPQFVMPTTARWVGLFSINLDTDDGISLNKRGSGIRRMILVSFFKAEAERRLRSGNKRSIIYALEEPETAQHPNSQRILIEAFKQLSEEEGCQVLLTTHSPGLASELPASSIRFIDRDGSNHPVIEAGADVFSKVAEALGLTPDSRVKVLVCLEGPTDIKALKHMSKALHQKDPSIIDLSTDPRIAFVLLGGGTLVHWVNDNYLRQLGCKEFHLYDNDVPKYQQSIDTVNARGDGSFGVLTSKHEIENYLHPDAVKDAYGVAILITDVPGADKKTVPKLFGESYSAKMNHDGIMKESKAKAYLSDKAFSYMTPQRIADRDPSGEVEGWFRTIEGMLN